MCASLEIKWIHVLSCDLGPSPSACCKTYHSASVLGKVSSVSSLKTWSHRGLPVLRLSWSWRPTPRSTLPLLSSAPKTWLSWRTQAGACQTPPRSSWPSPPLCYLWGYTPAATAPGRRISYKGYIVSLLTVCQGCCMSLCIISCLLPSSVPSAEYIPKRFYPGESLEVVLTACLSLMNLLLFFLNLWVLCHLCSFWLLICLFHPL